jgi:RNA polymerase sigma-70 factor (ECF subfamily)
MKQLSDQEARLVQQAVHDREAFAVLYRCYVMRIYRYALIHTGNVTDAQDITSQTFLAALEHIAEYRNKGSFVGWLLAIARYKVLDHYRYKRPVVSLEVAENLPLLVLTPEEIVAQQMQISRIKEALNALADDRAEALRLHIFGGLNAAEIGQIMKRSQSASKMLIHRALRDLKERLIIEED